MKRCSSRHAARGFSLIEIMTVLAIIIALGSIAAVKFGKTNYQSAVNSLTRETSSLLQQARFTARSTRRQVCLTFNSYPPTSNDTLALRPTVEMRVSQNPAVPVDCAVNGTPGSPLEGQVNAHRDAAIRNFTASAQPNTPFTLGYPNGGSGGQFTIIFHPSGQIQPMGQLLGTGATLFLTDTNVFYRQRLLIFGRTGFVKLIDS